MDDKLGSPRCLSPVLDKGSTFSYAQPRSPVKSPTMFVIDEKLSRADKLPQAPVGLPTVKASPANDLEVRRPEIRQDIVEFPCACHGHHQLDTCARFRDESDVAMEAQRLADGARR